MNPQDPELLAIVERLDRLERQNRRFKLVGATLVFFALSVPLIMGQARTTRVLEANEFVLRDTTGKIRARLGIGVTGMQLPSNAPADLASLELYDPASKPMARLMAATNEGAFNLGPSSPGMPGIGMSVNSRGATQVFSAGTQLTQRTMYLNADPAGTNIILSSPAGPAGKIHGIHLRDGESNGPEVAVFDSAGFAAEIGVTQNNVIATGEQRTTSAASLVLLNNHKVIWTAP